MEAKQIVQISETLKQAKDSDLGNIEFAGTPEEEKAIYEAAGIAVLNEYKKARKLKYLTLSGEEKENLKHVAGRKEKAYWDRVYTPKEYKKLTALELYKHIIRVKSPQVYGTKVIVRDGAQIRVSKFKIDKWNSKILKQLCFYFTDDVRFDGNLEKGIILYGPPGCGKTTLFEMFCINQKQSFRVRHSMEIAAQYQKYGVSELEKYYQPLNSGVPDMYFGQEKLGYCFDDFGTEFEKGNYGNKVNVMRDIILQRNQAKRLIPFTLTHLSTNLTTSQIKNKYGADEIDIARLARRFKEMFNTLAFDPEAPDRSE